MKTTIQTLTKITLFTLTMAALLLLSPGKAGAQACTPQGNQTTYGTNNVWIAYVYQGKAFNKYKGYATEGIASNPNFDESFGGAQVNYNTNGCPAYTDTFSVRYKLTKTFANGSYTFTVGGDDGYRLSLDGGSTWVINNWNDQSYATASYTVTLNGTYNMVLEYYENFGDNRISFNLTVPCNGTGNETTYGTGNTWIGYIYQGMTFNSYKGTVSEGGAGNYNFDENFGNTAGGSVTYNTNVCTIQTVQFSARYRLQKNLPAGTYVFTIGGDDGYRFSLDGGSTWVINKWNDQGYTINSYTATLSGMYNMVLEYYQNGGYSRVSFNATVSTLPITLVSWTARAVSAGQNELQWKCTDAVNFDHFNVQRSTDGASFANIGSISGSSNNAYGTNGTSTWSYVDSYSANGSVYYRLSMVDKDGTTTYSSVLELSAQSVHNVKIYPTVVENGSAYIETPEPVNQARWELYDMSGRKLSQKEWGLLSGRQEVSLTGESGSRLKTGTYIVRLTSNNAILARQILMVR